MPESSLYLRDIRNFGSISQPAIRHLSSLRMHFRNLTHRRSLHSHQNRDKPPFLNTDRTALHLLIGYVFWPYSRKHPVHCKAPDLPGHASRILKVYWVKRMFFIPRKIRPWLLVDLVSWRNGSVRLSCRTATHSHFSWALPSWALSPWLRVTTCNDADSADPDAVSGAWRLRCCHIVAPGPALKVQSCLFPLLANLSKVTGERRSWTELWKKIGRRLSGMVVSFSLRTALYIVCRADSARFIIFVASIHNGKEILILVCTGAMTAPLLDG